MHDNNIRYALAAIVSLLILLLVVLVVLVFRMIYTYNCHQLHQYNTLHQDNTISIYPKNISRSLVQNIISISDHHKQQVITGEALGSYVTSPSNGQTPCDQDIKPHILIHDTHYKTYSYFQDAHELFIKNTRKYTSYLFRILKTPEQHSSHCFNNTYHHRIGWSAILDTMFTVFCKTSTDQDFLPPRPEIIQEIITNLRWDGYNILAYKTLYHMLHKTPNITKINISQNSNITKLNFRLTNTRDRIKVDITTKVLLSTAETLTIKYPIDITFSFYISCTSQGSNYSICYQDTNLKLYIPIKLADCINTGPIINDIPEDPNYAMLANKQQISDTQYLIEYKLPNLVITPLLPKQNYHYLELQEQKVQEGEQTTKTKQEVSVREKISNIQDILKHKLLNDITTQSLPQQDYQESQKQKEQAANTRKKPLQVLGDASSHFITTQGRNYFSQQQRHAKKQITEIKQVANAAKKILLQPFGDAYSYFIVNNR
ncbi:hypothetical protein [Ehrlichia canis]|uniref:Uncharacterized protein n=1 Tax=Ehrlichia canis (strain Jake) TaxID=269484 RepID=A0ACA6AVH3_EHRCJ|nr:hypothetical protein [Ehrlichia canis]AAZ68279.1 hypothetical protein Ecaj_0230 [Ehrlichia canis str. Jake]AUO54959.1 hypothetical protein C1I72_03735 [Ehrlichia canis]UKC53109.1 hypothetical protein s20019040002_000152 [Ehrlichia canis]UKC54046.1 hypothetical protein s20026770001_000152 [Ehrlichia canis]UKC54982.1 hypothetical protein s21009500007_000152 [Ehrlichia canis]